MKTSLSVSQVFSNAWKALQGNFWVLVGLLIAYCILSLTLSALSSNHNFVSFIVAILSIAISTIYTLGFARICLDALDGNEPQFSSFKDQLPNFWKGLGLTLLAGLVAVIWICFTVLITFLLLGFSTEGLMGGGLPNVGGATIALLFALQLPLIYVIIRLQFATLFIVENGDGIIAAFKNSWRITDGQIVPLILLALLQLLIVIAGIICLFIGIFPAAVLTNLILCAAYKELKASKTISE